eukprot:6751203-Prymnesium_polylepis.1
MARHNRALAQPRLVWIRAQSTAHEAFELAEVLQSLDGGTLRVRVPSAATADAVVRLGLDAFSANRGEGCATDLTALEETHPAALLH